MEVSLAISEASMSSVGTPPKEIQVQQKVKQILLIYYLPMRAFFFQSHNAVLVTFKSSSGIMQRLKLEPLFSTVVLHLKWNTVFLFLKLFIQVTSH